MEVGSPRIDTANFILLGFLEEIWMDDVIIEALARCEYSCYTVSIHSSKTS